MKIKLRRLIMYPLHFVYDLIMYPLNFLEKIFIRKYKREKPRYPPVFLIGAPRTGSTVLFQYITNYMDVLYTNNFLSFFLRAIFLFSFFSEWLFKGKQHNAFDSRFGKTGGWNGPHEGGDFWYRWFPSDRHFADFDELPAMKAEELRSTITALANRHKKAVVFKNLPCSQRLRPLSQIFPEALFIYCRRKPVYTAESILEGREALHNDRTKWFGPQPREYHQIKMLPCLEQIAKQVNYLEGQIKQDLGLFNSRQWMEVWYHDFCADPKKNMQEINSFFSRNGLEIVFKSEVPEDELQSSDRITLDETTFKALKSEVDKLEW